MKEGRPVGAVPSSFETEALGLRKMDGTRVK